MMANVRRRWISSAMLTGARKVAEKSAGTSGAFADVAAKLKKFLEARTKFAAHLVFRTQAFNLKIHRLYNLTLFYINLNFLALHNHLPLPFGL